jgi:RNA polymerase sigma factor (sigma-70 family)
MSTTQPSALLRHLRQLAGAQTADSLSDRELLRRFTAGQDEAAFTALVRRHGPMVLSVCQRRLHRTQDIEDAFQATFLVLLRKAAKYPWREGIGGWLHGVASRVALRVHAETVRSVAVVGRAAEEVHADPLEQLTARELFAAFDEELTRLPATYRDPLVLCCLQGHPQEEAARQLGWSLSTVRRRLESGRKLLHTRMARRGLSLPAALAAALLSRQEATAALPVPALPDAFSARATLLADAVLRASVRTSLKATAALLVMLGVLAAGAGWAAHHMLATEPPQATATTHPETPKSEKAERTDRYGDPLPPGALVRMGTVRFRHRDCLGNVAFSPDGKILAAGGYTGAILLYDAATGRKLHELRARTINFPAFAFAPDGKTLACVGTKTIQIWDTATGKELRRFLTDVSDRFTDPGTHFLSLPLALSRDGCMLASVAPDHSVRVWDVKNGKELVKLSGHQNRIRCLAFSPDGKTLSSASGDAVSAGTVHVWDVATGKELRKFPLHQPRASGQPTPLCISPDGQTLAFEAYEFLKLKKNPQVLTWHVIHLLDLRTGEVRRKLEPQEGRFKAAAISPDGKTFATMKAVTTVVGNLQSEDNNRIQVWETATGKQLFDLPAYSEHLSQGPCRLTFSPDGKKLAAASTASSLHVWDVTHGREDPERAETHHNAAACVVFSPDGRTLASGSADHTVALWDAATGAQRPRLHGHEGIVSSLAFSPDGKWLASASRFNDQTVRLWDAATGKEIRQYLVPFVDNGDGSSTGVSTWVAFAAGGKILAAGGTDHKVRLWDVATGKELLNQVASGLPAPPRAGLGTMHHWTQMIQDVAFAPDGRVMALSTAKTIHVVDVAAGQQLFQFDRGGETTALLVLSPDGKTLLCGGRGPSFRLVEIASGKDLAKVNLPDPEEILAAAFAPDGRSVAVRAGREEGKIYLFDVPTGKELLRLRGPGCFGRSLGFSPDGTKLASGQWDGTALVWDVSPARRKRPAKDLAQQDLDRLWNDLKSADAPKAHAALWALVAAPEGAVPLLKDRLRPVPRVPADRLHRLVADLDAEDFARREEASRELAKLGTEVEPELRQALKAKTSLEMRRRVEALLGSLICQTEMTPDALRRLRAIQVLEQIGSPEARRVLETLTRGAPAAPATRDATSALARLTNRAAAR